MTLLAGHLIPTHWGQADEEQLRRIHPRSFKVIDAFSRVARMHELSPNSLVVYRDHPLSEQHSDMFADPIRTGRRHADDWANKLATWAHPVPKEQQIVLGINEPHVWDTGGVAATVAYTVAFLDRLTTHGIRGGALNLSVGWPANNGTDLPPDWSGYAPVEAAIRRGSHILFLHEYWPHYGVDYQWGWLAGRALRCPWDVPIIIGECGLEERVIPGNWTEDKWGWRGWFGDNPRVYVDQLLEYERRMAADPRIHSLQVFSWDYSNPFASLDIRPILPMLPANYAWDNAIGRDKPPEPPPDDFAKRLMAEANRQQLVFANPDSALQKAIVRDGFWANSNEFEYEGVIAKRAESPFAPRRVRTYYVRPGDWGNVKMVEG